MENMVMVLPESGVSVTNGTRAPSCVFERGDAERRFPTGVSPDMPRKIYKLCVSYDEAGAELRQHLADDLRARSMNPASVWQASFRDMQAADLPPGDGVVWVYPVFMQSGWTVTEALPEKLRALYAERGQTPELEFKPVWGAGKDREPFHWIIGDALMKELEPGTSLLLVAHGVGWTELPPEPAEFLQSLRLYLRPQVEDMALAYFGASPSVEEVFPQLKGEKVVVLPFLIGEGKHLREDMPTPELAARFGKELRILPPLGTFYLQAQRRRWEKEPAPACVSVSTDILLWPDPEKPEEAYPWYLRQFEKLRKSRPEQRYGVMKEGADTVLAQIHQAFEGVELGSGLGLMQSDYLDDCESAEICLKLAEADERHDWRKLTDDALNFCEPLAFTDAEGFRFLIPAFMCCELRGCLWAYDLDFFMTCSEDWAEWHLTKMALLNGEQRRAMEAFLDFIHAGKKDEHEDRKLPWQWD